MTNLSHDETVEIEGEKWKPMNREEVEEAIKAEPCKTHIYRYHSHQEYYEWKLEEDRFLSVILLASNKTTGCLTQGPRMIRDVAERMVNEGHTFQSLIENCDLPWYDGCLEIEKDGFDYAKFGTIWLKKATNEERCQSSPGKYHIDHGAHRSLVLGKLLRERKRKYQRVRAIYIKTTTGSREPCY